MEAGRLHHTCRLAGNVENELLTLPESLISWLVMLLRQKPCPAPECPEEDWDRLLELLRSHWITATLYWYIRQIPDECQPPEAVMNRLHDAWIHAVLQTMKGGMQIKKVIGALENEGIPVLLLKGPALGRTVYPSSAMRQGSDIDMLISMQDMKRCERVMADLGYHCPVRTADHSSDTAHHQNFHPASKKTGPFVIEMHWRLDCRFGLMPDDFIEEIFSRSIRVEADDCTFSTLSVEDHLLYQAFHMACQHCHGTRLSWICDIAYLSRQIPDAAGWDHLIRLSVERNCRLSLESAISMARFWTGLSLPPEVCDIALWPVPSKNEEDRWELAMNRVGSIPSLIQLSLHAIPNTRGKLKYLYRFVFPHPELMSKYCKGTGGASLLAGYWRRWMLVFRYI